VLGAVISSSRLQQERPNRPISKKRVDFRNLELLLFSIFSWSPVSDDSIDWDRQVDRIERAKAAPSTDSPPTPSPASSMTPKPYKDQEMKVFIAALAAAAFGLSVNAAAAEKPPIVLVYGAFENDQVWGDVTSKLEADGYKVATVNLPGRPGNPLSPDKVSLDH
jgi:hypothetical protein